MGASKRLVSVAVPTPPRRLYTYRVPEPLPPPSPGVRVRVPLGRRSVTGVVVGSADASPEGAALRDLREVLDEEPLLSPEVLELTRRASEGYLVSWGVLLRAALPPELEAPRRVRVRLTERGREAAERGEAGLERLVARPEGLSEAVARRHVGGAAALRRCLRRGWVERSESAGARRRERAAARPAVAPGVAPAPERLTPDQEAALASLRADMGEGRFRVHLLAGVTGSGKTEVYLRAMAETLDRGRTALFLVPEIGLAPILSRAVRGRFGEIAAILHSGLRPEERLAEWRRVHEGRAKVVLGARSAVFAPLRGLGIVVVDEEHEGAYKQEETPRYHGRDLALVRAAREGAVALLGSATPSLESWHRARQGSYRLSLLPRRVSGRPLPEVEVVDMREEFRITGSTSPLSERLVEALAGLRERGEQAIVLLNRRGYASFVLCRECGETVLCPRCELSLTYHRGAERLRCHYCNHSRPRPSRCPGCESAHLHFGGEGTERAERHLRRRLPDLRVLRMDRDTVRAREGHLRILAGFEAGEADVLLGTQMVAKGHDFPRVTLVGVLAADAVLGRPDFRAAERTFQMITQVAGRAGRGEGPGRVLVQAFRPGHPAIRSALDQDHAAFAAREMRYRRALGYPPCSHLARVLVSDSDPGRARERARRAFAALEEAGEGHLVILGPAPAPLARLRGRHRVHLLVRAGARGRLVAALRGMLDTLDPDGGAPRGLLVDVDPLQLQ